MHSQSEDDVVSLSEQQQQQMEYNMGKGRRCMDGGRLVVAVYFLMGLHLPREIH